VWVASRVSSVQFSVPPLTPLVKQLLIALGVIYVVQSILVFMDVPFVELLALWPAQYGIGVTTLWQVFTYVVVEASPDMAIVSFLFFWLLVSPFEIDHGRRRTWQLIAVSTLAPAAAVLLVHVLGGATSPLVGVGRIGTAALVAFCWKLRDVTVRWFGILPLTGMQALGIGVGFTVLNYLWSRDLGSLIATFATMGASIGFIEWMRRGPGMFAGMFARSRKPKRGGLRVVQGGRDSDPPKWLN
jgi:membrane associated rhomboid family serine protease